MLYIDGKVSSLEQHYHLTEKVLSDMNMSRIAAQDNTSTFEASIYALDFAIIYRIEYVIQFVIDWHQDKESLNRPTTSKKLTPLHVAVITGHEEAVKKLIRAGASVNAQDGSKWTPLHHAAVQRDRSMIALLREAGADPTIKSATGGTFENILNCLNPVREESDAPILLYWKENEEPEKLLAQGEFKRLTKATYVQETYLTPEQMIDEWSATAPPAYRFSFEQEYAKLYDDFIKNPPVHLLKKVTRDSNGHETASSSGISLYARHNIEAGTIVGEYKGLWVDYVQANPYSLAFLGGKGINAIEYRNEIPQIDDGFNNLVLVPGRNVGGLSTRDLLVASDRVYADEQFCWNYGFNPPLKILLPYVELRPKEARAFIKHYQIEGLDSCLQKVGAKVATFEEFLKGEKFRYLLQTPSVIFLMIFDKTLTADQGTHLFNLATTRKCILPNEMISDLQKLPEIAKSCLVMRDRLSQHIPHIALKYEAFICSLPARAGLLFTLKSASSINTRLSQLISKFIESPSTLQMTDGALSLVWSKLEEEQLKLAAKHVELFSHIPSF